MMSRKNFEMLAGVINNSVRNVRVMREVESRLGDKGHTMSHAQAVAVESLAYNLVQKLADENPRFDHMRFYKACDFAVTENYPLVFEGGLTG